METLLRLALAVTGLLNAAPGLLLFVPQRIGKSYGVTVPNASYELLLRHRAALFLLVGGLLLFSAATKRFYGASLLVGLLSMGSFVVLYFLAGKAEVSAELQRVMQLDVAAIVLLVIACLLNSSRVATTL